MTTEESEQTKSDKLKDDDPDSIFRIYSVISYIVVLIVIGLPVWWMTTRVYRAALPLEQMYNVELSERIDKAYGLPLSLEYDILITIVNPNPKDLNVDLDGELLDINLQPFLSTISSVANFTVKTQWLYLTDLEWTPKKHQNYYALSEQQLPHIITPLEKKLWSHVSPRPCINLVLYFSPCNMPLFIHDKNDNKLESNSFLSSRWGGIFILNPDPESCKTSIYKPDTKNIILNFITQLRHLLQIKGSSPSDLREFKETKIKEMISSTKRTLKSLAQLLSEINSIVISDDVADKINLAVKKAKEADMYLEEESIEMSLSVAKIAYENSEAAFSDPSLLALLYFPDDQKYAVYIPLFLPVMIPVLMSIMTVRRWYVNLKKQKLKPD